MKLEGFDILGILKEHKGVVHVGLGQVVSLGIGAVLWIVIARLLLPVDYGWINYIISLSALVSFGVTLGLPTTVATYYPKEEREALISESVLVVFIASLIASVVAAIWEPLLFPLIMGFSLFSIAVNIELGRRRYSRYMWLWVGAKLASVPFAIGLYFTLGLSGFLFGYAFPSLALAIVSFGRLRGWRRSGFDEVKSKVSFASKALGVDLARGSSIWLDKVVVGGIFGLTMLGIYFFAYQIYTLLSFLPTALFSYLLPEKSAGVDMKKVELLGIGSSFVLAITTLGLTPLLIPRIFPNFLDSVRPIQIMAFAVIPAVVVGIKMPELYARERPGAVLAAHAVAVAVGISGMLLFGSYFGAIGLAAGVVLLQSTLAIILVAFEKKWL
jgi:O-antigen/teichoic acid export membrane protein